MSDPSTCAHPGAHVHGLLGQGPRPIPPEQARVELAPAEWGRLDDADDTLRAGERMTAAIGACADCGSLVVSVSTWNPADGRGVHARTYDTPWVAMYAVGGEYGVPVAADPAARPALRPLVVGADGQDYMRRP